MSNLFHVKCLGDNSYLTDNGTFCKRRQEAAILTKDQAEEKGYPFGAVYVLVPIPTVWEEDGSTGPVLLCPPS